MHHEALIKGGVGMTTMAYVAVEKDGRTLPDQVWVHDEAMADLRAVTGAVHQAGGNRGADHTRRQLCYRCLYSQTAPEFSVWF